MSNVYWDHWALLLPLIVLLTMSDETHSARLSVPKRRVADLLKALETGADLPMYAINPNKYIQHNLDTPDGWAAAQKRWTAGGDSVRFNTIRVFQDDNYVFTHSEFYLDGPKIGFDVFRFENGLIVEHWDNYQPTPAKPNLSNHTMTDGPTEPIDQDKTAANKALVRQMMDENVKGNRDRLPGYFNNGKYLQHNPDASDDLSGFAATLQAFAKAGTALSYTRIYKVLGEGNFVLVMSEGLRGPVVTAFYDLFRVENGKVAEHWDVLQPIPPREQWKNKNGKF